VIAGVWPEWGDSGLLRLACVGGAQPETERQDTPLRLIRSMLVSPPPPTTGATPHCPTVVTICAIPSGFPSYVPRINPKRILKASVWP